MERTVPRTDSDEIDLYVRTYYSLLRSSGETAIETLVESHIGMESLLHPQARKPASDVSALVYSSLRLPACIVSTRLILLGQRSAVFERWGYPVETWQSVQAQARRRRTYFDGQDTLAVYIASRSDIDDILPTLTAYQIEWNKIHHALSGAQAAAFLDGFKGSASLSEDEMATLAGALGIKIDDTEKLCMAWGKDTVNILRAMAQKPRRMFVRLLAGSLADYRKAMRHWWASVCDTAPQIDFERRRVYFVSSNTHSLVNLWSGYALRHRDLLLKHIERSAQSDLLAEYREIESRAVPSSRENFLYYTLKKYLQDQPASAREKRTRDEKSIGVHRVSSQHDFELDAQVIEIGKVNAGWLDPRLCLSGIEMLSQSEALIFNVDYPLGMGAYEVLTRTAENVGEIAGIYIMGKAATLNGRVSDVMIPTVVHDEHSSTTYLFQNCFSSADLAPYLIYGTVMDNQKCVSVRGTFLQNRRYMSVFYREGYTDIEMEAGPYFSATYELMRPKRHPQNEIVSLQPAPFDIGVIHYASDTPLNKGKNLGAGNLSYQGMDPTYAAAVAILRRIIAREIALINQQNNPTRQEPSTWPNGLLEKA